MADPLGLHPLEPPPNEACQPIAALAPRGSCILDVVAAAAASPASVAFYGGAGEEGLAPLTYGALLSFARTAGEGLFPGVARGAAPPRLATVLRNSAASAVSFVALTRYWTLAPLSGAISRGELAFELDDLPAAAVLLDAAVAAPWARAECARSVPSSTFLQTATCGAFAFAAPRARAAAPPPREPATLATVALVLHTSGTTNKPKLVPLTHGNLCAGATAIGETLALKPDDVCVNVMPLFHIHGLAVNVLATLLAGAAVVCEHALDCGRFYELVRGTSPLRVAASWYSAVPTLHFAVAAAGEPGGPLYAGAPLPRLAFARSCSAALPPSLSERLEVALAPAKALPTYAMTESMPIASARCPRRGPRGDGELASAADPNVEAFVGGARGHRTWLRTGDRGLLEPGGARGPRLRLVGRSKEIVNRGGEKVSPLAVEDVLLRHAAVKEVACFAAPHAQLGEVVGAVVVLKPGRFATLDDLRDWCVAGVGADRALDAKWAPETAVYAARVPKGPTGKPLRIKLAAKIGLPALDALKPSVATYDVGDDAFDRGQVMDDVALRAAGRLRVDDARAAADAPADPGVDSMAFLRGRRGAASGAPSGAAMQGHLYFVAMFGILCDHGMPPRWPALAAACAPLLALWAAMCALDVASHVFYGALRAATGVCVLKGYGAPCYAFDDFRMISFWETKWFALVLCGYPRRGLGLALRIPKTGTGKMKVHKLVAGLFYFFAPPLMPEATLTPACSAHDRDGACAWPCGVRLGGPAARRATAGLLGLHGLAALTRIGYGGWPRGPFEDPDWATMVLGLVRGGANAINLVPFLDDTFAISFPGKCALCAARPDAPGAYGDREPFLPEKHS
ncbi:ligase [Aureococcus anophagefferens]|nr:ligase [Aureococcus anophagefferens]